MDQRKAQRIDTELKIVMEPLDEGEDSQSITAEVVDVSKSGIGFLTPLELKEHSFYRAKLVFQSKESVDVVIEVVHHAEAEGEKIRYGGCFVGISEGDQFKIEVFRLFAEQEIQKQ